MAKRYNILIVEDDLLIAEMLKEMLLELGYSVVSICKSFDETIDLLKVADKIDLVFLDVNLTFGKNGIELAKVLNQDYFLPFVYLTSYSDPLTIKDAVSTFPEAYLVKPFTKSEIFSTIELSRIKNTSQKENSIIIKDGNKRVKLMANEILYVKSDKNYLEISMTENRIVTRHSLEAFIEELDDDFVIRIHRSFAVNISAMKSINNQNVILQDITLPLSRKYKDIVHQAFAKK